MNTIGIDISKEWFDCFCSARRLADQFPNNPAGWEEFITWIQEPSHIVMEASGPYYLGLASYLSEQGIKVSVVNPLVIRRYGQMKLTRTKTDAKDAVLITQYGIDQQPAQWHVPSEVRQALQQLMSLREGLLRQQAMMRGQNEAFSQNKDVEPLVHVVIGQQQKALTQHIQKIDKRIEALAKKHYKQKMQALLTIPGIGKKTAIMLLAITDGFKRFDNPRKLASYVGISPPESGNLVHR
jgi:transposase